MKFKPEMLQLYFIVGTQDTNNDSEKLLRLVKEALDSGATAIQYREKGSNSYLNTEEKINLGKKIHHLTKKAGVPLFVDDDYDLARAINAGGIHVGQSDTDPRVIYRKSPDLIIGLSVHNLAELKASQPALKVVDYLGTGSVYVTTSKKEEIPPVGVSGVKKVAENTNLPIVAIGGIQEDNVATLKDAPIAGIATISAITKSNNVARTVKVLKQRGR
ncbi:thiamine phosphate synthase [Lactobacillus acetotolerans]|jgi:thiamine-phosphate pyrophosphorylase|uniref:thiamine phosphate synthase n=1 Tax=Lactobacillus acetotolerans TaxID=1600 RepID=UPI00241DE01D|nr:thiamine phosphate synthase [Lactobacillus acetotolerans]